MKYIFMIISSILMAMGLLGIVLPGLPATPFILGAAFFGTKGSSQLSDWIKSSYFYDEYMTGYQENKGFTGLQKFKILSFAGVSIGLVIYFGNHLFLRLFLVSIYTIKVYVFLKVIPTVEKRLD